MALPATAALKGSPVLLHVTLVGALAAVAYLAVLRVWFVKDFADLSTLARRVLPIGRLQKVVRRVAVFGGPRVMKSRGSRTASKGVVLT